MLIVRFISWVTALFSWLNWTVNDSVQAAQDEGAVDWRALFWLAHSQCSNVVSQE